jgi:amino acid adenylation domain-containing protein
MTAAELLSVLRKHNTKVTADNGQLIIHGPKGALTSELRAKLIERKEEILNFLSNTASSAYPDEPVLQCVSRDRTLCLSFAQQRLWFLDQYEPGSAVYNVSRAVRLKGCLDIDALERGFNEIVRRHEALRTSFLMIEGEAVQVIAPSQSLSLAVLDLSDGLETEREDEARRLAREEARRRSFDLSRGPLVRATVIRLSADDHVLVLTMHHIVSDGWSMGVLYHELSVLYGAFTHNQPSPLSELPIQYADYAVWQRQWLKGEVLESQLSYWKKQLEGIPGVLHLPTDHPRPAVQSYRGKRQSIELSKELTQGVKDLSRKEGVTLFMTLLAAFQTLIYCYTGQKDIVVGSPIANRNRAEIEGLIGFFVNTLVLRTNFSGDPTFKELLGQVRETALGAYAHQDLPFEKLVEELKPERSLSHSPLFQLMFVLQNAPAGHRELSGLELSPVRLENNTTKFDLSLSLSEQSNRIKGSLEYSTDLFDEATIIRMIGHLQTLLEGIVANPNGRVSELPVLTEAEKHQLLTEWNDTKRDYPQDKCIHELFEAQVEKSPNAVAVTFEEDRFTYRELNGRANQLARYLQKLGVGPETLVAICMERSLEMVVGLLGILKAGGAYVALDPEYPQERLAFMLEDAQPAVLVTQERLQEKFSHPHARIVCLDRDWEQIAKEKQENTHNKASTDNVAYVIYTSGTTGQPKGVMISHYNISRLFRATEAWFHFSNNDVWTMFHSYAFDFSVWEMWGALLYGGRVVIVPFWISRSPEKFYELLGEKKVTVLNQTPSAFHQLIQADQSISNRTELALRLIIFGGEALDFQSLRPWLDRHGDQYPQLVNMYGITETTVHVTYRVVRATDVKQGVGSLIGVPLPDLNLYVLDNHRQLVPIGIPGELYVGGAGVGRGYLNRPELTAERFIANPFNERKADKLYKTGDLVRRMSNGDLEYLGRTDAQVKLRGYRIELGEIESVLSQHPAVQEAAVLAREDNENPKSEIENLKSDKRLVAYVVPRREPALTVGELRSFLKKKLPEYMVPLAFVFLDALPLTPNGKVDRQALPAVDQNRPEPEESYVAPRTQAEEMLAKIWAEVLKLDKIGIHDNFFALGGHSLLATQVISRVRNTFQVEVPVRTVFEMPTVVELENAIEEAKRKGESLPPKISISRQPRRVQSSL